MTLLRARSRGIREESPPAGLAPASSRVARLATLGLVAGLLLAANGQQAAEPSGAVGAGDLVPVAAQARRAAACTDLLVVAVDGNGQGKGNKPGQVVSAITNKVQKKAAGQGRTVTVKRVRLKTPGSVVTLRTQRGPAAGAVSRAGLKRWKKPIRSGIKATRKQVNRQLASCPEQQVLLVGYAQGAAVAHQVAQDLDKRDSLGSVPAVVTISDPARTKKSSAGRPLGNPGAGRASEGILTRFTRSAGDVPDATGTFRVISVCHKGDLVCNPGRTAARKALGLSLSYASKKSRAAMRTAASRAYDQVSLWPVVSTEQVVVGIGEQVATQVAVQGGSPTGQAARFTPVTVPAGLSLGETGALTGRIDTPGIYELRFTVAGVSPATSARTASVLVNVRAPSGGSAAGGQSSCGVRADTTLWCQGRNDFGQLGDGTTTLRINPVQVAGGAGWSKVATGGSFTCGVKTDGTLWCWGLNNFGQLGGADKATSILPRQVGTGTTWRDVSASWQHACATQTDGSAWCWGQNQRGQLGAGNQSTRSSAPVRVAGTVQWTSVSAGGWHTCGTTTSGTAFCWGDNAFGQVGDGTISNRSVPTAVTGGLQLVQVATTWGRSCGVTAAGDAWCWGENANGELGNGTRTNSAKPVQVSGGGFTAVGTALTATCGTRADGAVSCWGDNRYGQLGPAATGSGSTTPVGSGLTATGPVTGGWLHLCAEGAGCWGANDAGQLGDGTIVSPRMPAEAAPSWGPGTAVTTKQVKQWSAEKVAQKAISSRPKVNGRAKRGSTAVQVMTFNVLGSQHTAPGGARPNFAPGRVRAEWAKTLISQRGATLVGLSEPQPDQITALDVATNGDFSFYPGNTMGYDAAPQSVMWKDSEWSFVWGNTVQMPFMGSSRPQALVRLRNTSTGQEVYWINAHLSPGKMQADRDKGMEIIKQVVKKLNGDGLPILVTGDLNEHAKAFRRIACPTDMNAAVGGRTAGKACQLPKAMRVDWIFGKGGTFDTTEVNQGAQVRRTTDHAVVSSRFSVQ